MEIKELVAALKEELGTIEAQAETAVPVKGLSDYLDSQEKYASEMQAERDRRHAEMIAKMATSSAVRIELINHVLKLERRSHDGAVLASYRRTKLN